MARASISTSRASTRESHGAAVEQVVQMMRQHPCAALSLRDMANIAALSPYHFNRIFRSITGIPPGEFQAALRLERAKQLILTTTMSITEVCYEAGYSSLGTFTTRFTQLVGLPPRALRGLVEEEMDGYLELLRAGRVVPSASSGCTVTGEIRGPEQFTGIIFVGLFTSPIPQSRPVGGTLLTKPGAYHIGGLPDGVYYLRVAALPPSRTPLAFLLPSSSLLVAQGEGEVIVRNGLVMGQTSVALRRPTQLDPPILIAMPLLLANRVGRGEDFGHAYRQ